MGCVTTIHVSKDCKIGSLRLERWDGHTVVRDESVNL